MIHNDARGREENSGGSVSLLGEDLFRGGRLFHRYTFAPGDSILAGGESSMGAILFYDTGHGMD